jgi:hypothetical protein
MYSDTLFYRIKTNKVRCNGCGDVIESTHRHDFVTCTCGSISIDGGTSYFKRVFSNDETFEDLSETVRYSKEELILFLNKKVSASFRDAAIFFLKEWYNYDYKC